jgi:AbrB family looped-hinge helix DNA binding protein
VKLNSKGQLTIPAELRARHNLHPGDEVEVIEGQGGLLVRPAEAAPTRGQRAARRLRGTASTTMTTDELMALLRG